MYGLTYKSFAKVPAVFFTPREVQVEYLSSQQICDIKRGDPANYCRGWNSNQLKGS